VNVLDENVLASQRQLLRGWRIHFRQIAHKTPIRGITTVVSERRDKQFASRQLRPMVRQRLEDEPEA
jgi:hypothetical protein